MASEKETSVRAVDDWLWPNRAGRAALLGTDRNRWPSDGNMVLRRVVSAKDGENRRLHKATRGEQPAAAAAVGACRGAQPKFTEAFLLHYDGFAAPHLKQAVFFSKHKVPHLGHAQSLRSRRRLLLPPSVDADGAACVASAGRPIRLQALCGGAAGGATVRSGAART